MAVTITEKRYPWVRDLDVLNNGSIREDLLIVDVRTPAEFAEAHIPGSLNVPLGGLPRSIEGVKRMSLGKQVVLMCRTQNRAKLAYEQLVEAGVQDCHVLEGGITKWMEANHRVIRGKNTISLERQVRMVAGALVALGVLLGVTVHPWFHTVPAVVGVGLFHAGLTDSCYMALALARFPYNK